jgi:hypothetical protein
MLQVMRGWTTHFLMLLMLIAAASPSFAREFTNLDFELATIPAPFPGQSVRLVDGALAVPGWAVMADVVLYNELTLGSPVVILTGPDHPSYMQPPLQGLYAPRLHYARTDPLNTPFLSQAGLIPAGTNWMTFLFGGGVNFRVTLGGEEISTFPIDGGRLAADVSAFAGREAELRFETYFVNNTVSYLLFDDVTFTPAPEPASSALVLIGSVFALPRRRRCNCRL